MQREREPRRLAHRAAERLRHEAENRWLAEQIDEAIDEDHPAERPDQGSTDRSTGTLTPRS